MAGEPGRASGPPGPARRARRWRHHRARSEAPPAHPRAAPETWRTPGSAAGRNKPATCPGSSLRQEARSAAEQTVEVGRNDKDGTCSEGGTSGPKVASVTGSGRSARPTEGRWMKPMRDARLPPPSGGRTPGRVNRHASTEAAGNPIQPGMHATAGKARRPAARCASGEAATDFGRSRTRRRTSPNLLGEAPDLRIRQPIPTRAL